MTIRMLKEITISQSLHMSLRSKLSIARKKATNTTANYRKNLSPSTRKISTKVIMRSTIMASIYLSTLIIRISILSKIIRSMIKSLQMHRPRKLSVLNLFMGTSLPQCVTRPPQTMTSPTTGASIEIGRNSMVGIEIIQHRREMQVIGT